MNQMVWIIRRTLVSTFRNKANWFVYVGVPIMSVLLAMLIHSNENTGLLRIGIINADGDQRITQDAIRFVEGLHHIEVTLTDEEALHSDIAAGKLDAGLLFDQGFAASVREGHPEHLQILSVRGAEVTAYVKAMMQSYLGNAATIGEVARGDGAMFDEIYASYSEQRFTLTAETLRDTSHTKVVTFQSIGYLVGVMMFSAMNMAQLILREKEKRTLFRLVSAPVSPWSYVLSNVVVNAFIMLIQIVVTLFAMKMVLRIDPGIAYAQLIPALLLFALTAISLALMLVAFATSTAAASALQGLIVTPTCLLAGCFVPLEIFPEAVRKISSFMPQYWLLDMIKQLQQGQALTSLYLDVAILLAFAAAFTLIAVFRFNRNDDVRQFV